MTMLFYVGSIVFLLISSSFKNDADLVQSSLYWFSLQTGPITNALKSFYAPFLLSGFVLAIPGAFFCFTSRRVPATIISIIGLCSAISLTSTLYYGREYEFRIVVSFIMTTITVMNIFGQCSRIGLERTYKITLVAMAIYAAVLITSNMYDYIFHLGFVQDNPRMFGSASHPNFFGVQLALSGIFLLSFFFSTDRILLRLASVAFFGLDCLLLKATGSRTGMLMLGCGVVAVLWIWTGRSAVAVLFLLVVCIVSLYAAMSLINLEDYFDAFARGGGETDTRSEAWSAMLRLISESPLLGYGGPVGNSENSFLRGWVSYGLFYTIIWTSTYITFFFIGILKKRPKFQLLSTLSGLAIAIMIGSNLEGFMVDNFSPGLLTGIIVVCLFASERQSLSVNAAGITQTRHMAAATRLQRGNIPRQSRLKNN